MSVLDATICGMSLEFFNALSGKLAIELTEPTESIAANLVNQRASATAAIKDVSFTPDVFEDEDFRDLTTDEFTASCSNRRC
ncbi:hypothetical protein [Nocardia goodfellowii]|uniref:Uncharacterized protein n=1 Tax=Nocardia goodfellowii TaxID=882446 RepID=A0ABS4QI71_9NOCA|nr:hypothetical protein [Nocardia goodfellowii]MBP2191391.1 hypothetical protein [Nocardia goodfellowii]